MDNSVWHRQEVGLECIEADSPERKRQVQSGRRHGDLEDRTQGIQWPKIILLETVPEKSGCDGLSVVHTRLAWILAQDSIDNDSLLSVAAVSTEIPRLLHQISGQTSQ